MILVDKNGHLVSDVTVMELHYFAHAVGLKESWFQDKKIPHYDVTSRGMFEKVMVRGAVMVTSRELALRAVRKETR